MKQTMTQRLAAIKAVIFDMDGVIFDSEQVYFDAFWIAAKAHDVNVDDAFVRSFAGKTSATVQLMVHSALHGDSDKTQRFFTDWARARLNLLSTHGLPFKDGFLGLLHELKSSGYTIGLVTSANKSGVTENFARNDALNILTDFDRIITLEDVDHPKPHPQPYLMMMDGLGISAENSIVVEDSIPGASAAVAAGAQTIMINTVQPPQELEEQLVCRVHHHRETLAFMREHIL